MRIIRWLARTASNILAIGAPKQPDHIIRYTMYRRIERDMPTIAGRTLAISRSRNLAERYGNPGEVVEADWPEHDLTDLKAFGDGSFDAVVSDQVLEHVRDPFAALASVAPGRGVPAHHMLHKRGT